jgi:hypothetical protein
MIASFASTECFARSRSSSEPKSGGLGNPYAVMSLSFARKRFAKSFSKAASAKANVQKTTTTNISIPITLS